jgi:hypothetical protein
MKLPISTTFTFITVARHSAGYVSLNASMFFFFFPLHTTLRNTSIVVFNRHWLRLKPAAPREAAQATLVSGGREISHNENKQIEK